MTTPLITRLEEAAIQAWSHHEQGYRAFQQRGLGATNPFAWEPAQSRWDAGYQKAKREALRANHKDKP